MHEHGDLSGICSTMSLVDGDRYKEITVYSDESRVNYVKIESDFGAILTIGQPTNLSNENSVLFEKSPEDPL